MRGFFSSLVVALAAVAAAQDGGDSGGSSIVPFIVAILRYALLVEQGHGSAPEELILGDRQLQVIGVIWVVLMGLSVYAR